MKNGSIQVKIPDDEYWRSMVNCHWACPVGTDARGYVRAIASGDYENAYLIARGPNPLASICGRVCGAPCEAACRRSDIDQGVAIRALKRFVTQRFGPEAGGVSGRRLLEQILNHRERREVMGAEELACLEGLRQSASKARGKALEVAVIGSGPAGLAAAHDLALFGLKPTVFEMEPVPAGMLAVGIPAYRLPRELIAAEVDVIRDLGVDFRCNVEVGRDITFEQIREAHGATIIAVGAKRSRSLDLPGAQGRGVLGGVEFLRDVALGNPALVGPRIVVIGGGNVAYDVSRTVVRQTGLDVSRSALRRADVKAVNLVSLESLEEMPADDVEIIEGDEEGILRHHRLGPAEILRNAAGNVEGVKFKRVLRVFDENGRFAPLFNDEDAVIIEADTVLWAIGQAPDLSFIEQGAGVQITAQGMLECDPDSGTTTAPDVFAAGDIAHGTRMLIDAVASGKRAARQVYRYLTGTSISAEQAVLHLAVPGYSREQDYEKQERVTLATTSVRERIGSMEAQVEKGLSEAQASTEAARCLDCGVNTIFDSQKCILCGGCADVCPERCLRLVSIASLMADGPMRKLLEARFGPGQGADGSSIIKDETRCIRCGLCAERCPVDAIAMERMTLTGSWVRVK